ncbi:M23 family metallopeptidase [Flavobacteriaceae bacterium]|jgi:murein DD-endopeptidase MepM/ murein hydrolase activator NlpD|nr:M23 family metallopeptidase [Flavobacteriaceae bacterium]MDC1029737.1 M23 family metallopeptidase [Flavobacteriaceae bacterium]
MAKVKYFYDPETLSYRPIDGGKTLKVSNFFLFLISSLLFGVFTLFGLLSTDFLNTPKELLLERELNNYEFQFELLSQRLQQMENVMENIENRDNEIYRNYFEANPIPQEQRRAGFGGVNRYKNLEGFGNSDQIIATTKKIDILSRMLVVQSNSLDEIQALAEKKEELLAAIPTIQPIKKEDLKRMASGYGWRTDPFTKKRRKHYGMDFSAKTGTPVYATGDGIVKRADNRSSGYGRHIRIDHGFGYVSLYAHLSKYNVKRGQKVKRGEIIGYVGNTGRSVAPHLHYEIFKDKNKINPLNFYIDSLSPAEFDAIVNQASEENQSLD